MTKRKPFVFNTAELSSNLQESTGQGMGAFFGAASSAPQAKPVETNTVAKPVREVSAVVERTNERPDVRKKVRHSFDVYADQLISLEEIQHRHRRETNNKPSLGELIQAALDKFIRDKLRT